MKKIYFNYISLFLLIIISCSILSGCNHKFENESDEENDKYDGPDKAAEFERKRNTDPSTGEVSYRKMWDAVLETENLKNTNNYSNSSSKIMAPLTWIERGSNSDAVGPSNGNTRPGGGVTSGRMRTVWVDLADPTGKTVWVGGISGGLWKTNDVTAAIPAWTLINDYLSNLAVSGICQDPTNTNTMYFCTGEAYFTGGGVGGVGVFKSTDHGITWTLLPSSSTLTRCTKILCDAAGNVYVSTMGISMAVGLQRSTNGGTSWVSINPFTTTSRIVDFEISSNGTMHVVGGLSSAAGIGGYKFTANPAASTPVWQSATTPYTIPTGNGARVEIACLANTVYAAISNTNKIDSVAKSIDGGLNWTTTGLTATNVTDLNGAQGQGTYSNGIIIDPSDPNTVIVGSLRLLKSTDGGITFDKISEWTGTTGQYVHADIHNMAWYDNGNKLLVGTDGGLFYSNNKGSIFSDKNTGIRIKQFYGVSIHPTSTNYFLAGAQDNGTHQFNGAGLTSSVEVLGGDGGITAIDQDEPLFQTGAYVYANFRRSSNGGASWISNGSASTSGQFINPYDFDNSGNKVYAGYDGQQYLRWEDPHSGFTFTPVNIPEFGFLPAPNSTVTASVASVTVSPYTANRVYFGLTNGKVFKIDNADQPTPTVTDITPAGTAPGYVNSVNIGISDQDLTVTLANAFSSSTISVWNTTNGGTSWTGIDGNLPEMPVYWALYHPDTDTKMYIATEAGVFSTDLINGTSTVWAAETTFPTVKTSMLKYRSSDRTIAASTYGRGLWTAIIPNSSCIPASITIQPTNASICAGANTTFSITATGSAPLTYQWQVNTTGVGGPWMNLTNTAPYSNVTTAILTVTSATSSLNTYQYRVIVTGNCAPLTATSNSAILTVNPGSTLALTSAAGTSNQTVNLNSSITPITYTTAGGVTGATVTGLPAGVTGTYGGGTNGGIVIAGTPSTAGTFNYTVTTSGGCSVQTLTGTITVVTAPVLTLSSAAGTDNQSICINSVLTNISYTSTGGVTGATVTGLPTGVTGTYSGGSFTISGTPTITGTFNYSVTTSGNTPNAVANGTILVKAATTLMLTSAPSTTSQTVTLNSAITNITYIASGGVTGVTVTGLPAGVTGSYSGSTNGTFTISGIPTLAGTFSYTVTTAGGCSVQTLTGTITVVNGPSITLTSSTGSNTQIICLNTAISNITYTAAGGVTGVTVTGLPSGVTGSYSGGTNGTFTIAGTPTVTGSFNFTVATSGGSSSANSAGTINVNDNVTLTLTSPAITTSQTVNINTAITNIIYSTTNGVTGVVVTGLPAGITGTYAGGTNGNVTISGSPTTAGTYNYSITTSGGCGTQSRSGTITVVTPPSITQTSPASTTNQTICLGNAITSITYITAGGVTGATVTGLPSGVSGTYSGGTNGSYTINGIPAAAGTFNYTITATGGITTNGSISVNALPAAPTVNNNIFTYCQGFIAPALTANGVGLLWYTTAMGGTGSTTAPIPSTSNVGDITYYVSQTTNGCEGNRTSITVTVNSTPSAPAVTSTVTYCQGAANATALSATGVNLKWYIVATGGTSSTTAPIPSTTVSGSTTYYVSQTTGLCEGPRASIVVNITAGPAVTSQPNDITSCTTTATFTVGATGTGLVYQWQVSIDGGSTYSNITGANSATVIINNLTTAMANYKYRVIISAGSCGSVTSNSVTAKVGTSPSVLLSSAPSIAFNPSTNGSLFVTVNPSGNYTYQWKRNNVLLTNVTSNSITKANGLLDEFGTYQVTVFDVATGCVGISNSITVSDITSERGRLFISPNPTQGLVKVSFYSSTTAAQIRVISLYDSKGEKLLTKTFSVAGNYAFINLDLSAFIKGNYLLVLRDASGNKIASGGIIKL